MRFTKLTLLSVASLTSAAVLVSIPSAASGQVAPPQLASTSPGAPTVSHTFADYVETYAPSLFPEVFTGSTYNPNSPTVIYAVSTTNSSFNDWLKSHDEDNTPYVVRAVSYSYSQLDAETHAIAHSEPTLVSDGVTLQTWGPDPSTGAISVNLSAPTAAEIAQLVLTLTSEMLQPSGSYMGNVAELLTAQFGPNVVVASSYTTPSVATDRRNDTNPFHGGDNIGDPSADSLCTSGFPVTTHGAYGVLTAGHCGTGNWYVNGSLSNTSISPGAYIGSVIARAWDNNSTNDDYEIIGTSVVPDVWGGSASAPASYPVVGQLLPAHGSPIAFDGAQSREQRNLPTNVTNYCGRFTDTSLGISYVVCNLVGVYDTTIAGDSGGPIFQHIAESSPDVRAIGTIVGGNSNESYGEEIGPELSRSNSQLCTTSSCVP